MLFFVIVLGSFIAFREFYYFGTLNIYVSETNTTISIEGKGDYDCPKNFCSIKLFPKKYKISVQKENFSPFIFSSNVSFQKITEKKIEITPLKSTLFPAEKTKNDYKKGFSFPLQTSGQDRNIENFTIKKNRENALEKKLIYNSTPLFSFQNNIFISTDEIGRNAWIVSDEKVLQFSQKYKTLSPVFTDNIKRFYPQKDGFFSWENEKNEKFYFNGKKNIQLPFSPLSLFSACKLPSSNISENIWAYLSFHQENIAFFIQNITLPSQKNFPKVLLENISYRDINYIECTSSHSIKLFLYSGKVFILEF